MDTQNPTDIAGRLLDIARDVQAGHTKPINHLECFTIGAFTPMLQPLGASEAFDVLVEICRDYPSLREEGLDEGLCRLLSELVPATQTAEIPRGMMEILESTKANHLMEGVRRWYRLV